MADDLGKHAQRAEHASEWNALPDIEQVNVH
jgi:hypothetical protein